MRSAVLSLCGFSQRHLPSSLHVTVSSLFKANRRHFKNNVSFFGKKHTTENSNSTKKQMEKSRHPAAGPKERCQGTACH